MSRPGDAVESRAEAVAHAVAHGRPPAGGAGTRPSGALPVVAPAPAGATSMPLAVAGVLERPQAGLPLPPAVRERVEPHLGVSLAAARVVTGPAAAAAAASVGARAFTVGSSIVLGRGGSPHDTRLMAHEATHVAQQASGGAALHRTTLMRDLDARSVLSGVVDAVVPDGLKDQVLGLVRGLPGYQLLTFITGQDPLTGKPVAVDRAALVDQLMSYGPFGSAVARTLELVHAFEDVVALVTSTLARYDLTWARISRDVTSAWARMSLTDPSGALEIARQTVDGIVADVRRFVSDLVDQVLAVVRRAVLDVVEPLLTDDAALGPVWRLATKVLHRDPLRGVPVEATTVEILGDFLHLLGKDAVLDQMRERGTLQQTADWIDTQLATFLSILDQAGALFSDAWEAIRPANLTSLPQTLPSLARRALGLVARIGGFASTVVAKVLELVKASLLGWLTEHAEQIPGFRMIKVVLGRNPFTGEEFPRTPENLIGGFVSLLPGGEQTYAQLAESGVIADAAVRIETAAAELGISVEMVTATFRGVWDTFSLEDLLAPVEAFERVTAKFGEPLVRIMRFVSVVVRVVVELVLALMHFPSDLLAHIVSEVQQAVENIRKDPVGFLKNMFEALKRGVLGFFERIGGYLVDGLAAWLFHGLGKLGITIPKELSFPNVLKLVLDVLGLSVETMWTKLGEKVGPEKVAKVRAAVGALGGAWQFVEDVQEKGIGAIWEYVQTQLSTLWDTLLSTATTWVTETLVKKGLAKLATFLDPTGIMAVVNSVIAVVEAVNSAIEYAKEILEIVDRYVSTIAAVSRGDVTPGAVMIEKGFAAAIPVALGFLAPQVGLGNLPDEIAKIVGSLRKVVSDALDWVVDQAWKLGRSVVDALVGGGGQGSGAVPADGADASVDEWFVVDGVKHHLYVDRQGDLTVASDPQKLAEIAAFRVLVAEWTALVRQKRKSQKDKDKLAQIKEELKKHPDLWADVAESPRTGHAPNIGQLKKHGRQKSRWRPESAKGAKSWFPAWELESEHLIPRAQVSVFFTSLGLPPVDDTEYEKMPTIMLYRGTSWEKTYAQDGDNVILPHLRQEISAAAAAGGGRSAVVSRVTSLFGGTGHEAVLRAHDAVETEDRSHEFNKKLSNGEIRDAPPKPEWADLNAAYWAQAKDVEALLKKRVP